MSFAKQVKTELFDDSASILNPMPDFIPAPYIKSLAMCIALAALPPLPQIKILLLLVLVFFISFTKKGILLNDGSKRAFASLDL